MTAKHKLLSLFLFFLYLVSYGQSLDYFSSDSSRWYVRSIYPNANEQNPYFTETRTTVYGYQGDTLIDGVTWHKLFTSFDSSFVKSLNFIGYINSAQGIVLFQDRNFAIDTLYNFNLEVGDSALYRFDGSDSACITIQEVDSVQIDSLYHKRFIFNRISRPLCCFLDEVWIEGIGSVFGPLSPKFTYLIDTEMNRSYGLTCLFYRDELTWHNELYDNCFKQVILKVLNLETSKFKLFPNPFQDSFTATSAYSSDGIIEVVNINGEIIRSYQTRANEFTIELSEIPDGIYLVRLRINNIVITSKIIKSN